MNFTLFATNVFEQISCSSDKYSACSTPWKLSARDTSKHVFKKACPPRDTHFDFTAYLNLLWVHLKQTVQAGWKKDVAK